MKNLKINELEIKFIQILSLEFEMKSIEENLKLSQLELKKDKENSEIINSIKNDTRDIEKLKQEISRENATFQKNAIKTGFTSDEINKIKEKSKTEYLKNRQNKILDFYNISSYEELKEMIVQKDERIKELNEFINFLNKKEEQWKEQHGREKYLSAFWLPK